MRRHRSLYTLATALAGVALLATACGSSSGGSAGSGSPGSSASGTGSAPTAAAAAAGGGKTVDVCTVLPVSQVAQITGQKYTSGVASTGDTNGWTNGCAYNNDDATLDPVEVNFSNETAQKTWNLVHTGGVTDVSGLGDKAMWDNDGTLYVLKGGDLIQVNGLDSKDQSVALAQPVVAAEG